MRYASSTPTDASAPKCRKLARSLHRNEAKPTSVVAAAQKQPGPTSRTAATQARDGISFTLPHDRSEQMDRRGDGDHHQQWRQRRQQRRQRDARERTDALYGRRHCGDGEDRQQREPDVAEEREEQRAHDAEHQRGQHHRVALERVRREHGPERIAGDLDLRAELASRRRAAARAPRAPSRAAPRSRATAARRRRPPSARPPRARCRGRGAASRASRRAHGQSGASASSPASRVCERARVERADHDGRVERAPGAAHVGYAVESRVQTAQEVERPRFTDRLAARRLATPEDDEQVHAALELVEEGLEPRDLGTARPEVRRVAHLAGNACGEAEERRDCDSDRQGRRDGTAQARGGERDGEPCGGARADRSGVQRGRHSRRFPTLPGCRDTTWAGVRRPTKNLLRTRQR